MMKKWIALVFALVMLAACGASSSPTTSSAPASESSQPASSNNSSEAPLELVKDGKMVFKQLADPLFTMDYEPRQGSVTMQHFGLNFPDGYDTDWLGDSGFDAQFDLHNAKTDKVYGSVKITTAPADLAAYYGTSDPALLLEKMQSSFFTTEEYYKGLRNNIVKDFGYTLSQDAYGVAFDGGWNAFYLEFVDKDTGNCGLRFYLCNDQINEKFYSMMVTVNVPMDEKDTINTFRDIIFTLHPRTAN